jgi:hypothetical protein
VAERGRVEEEQIRARELDTGRQVLLEAEEQRARVFGEDLLATAKRERVGGPRRRYTRLAGERLDRVVESLGSLSGVT